MKSFNLNVGEWRKQEPGDTSKRYIFVHHHNKKKNGLFLWDFGKEPECSLLKDAAVIHALETVMTAVTWKRGLSVKGLEVWGVTQEDMMHLAWLIKLYRKRLKGVCIGFGS